MTPLLLAALTFAVIATLVTRWAIGQASDGFEDAAGFHSWDGSRLAPVSTRHAANGATMRGDDFAGGLA